MIDIFKAAETIKNDKHITGKQRKVGVLTRRDGLIIKDSIKRELKKVAVKARSVKVDRSELNSSTVDNFSDSFIRRTALGKRIYNEREQLIRVLVQGYSCSVSSVKDCSFNMLLNRFDSCKAKEASRLETLKKSKKEYKKRLGEFYNSFVLVSNIVSDTDTEVWNYDYCEKKEKEVLLSGSFQTAKEKKEKMDRWNKRKAVMKEKMDKTKRIALSEKFTEEEITLILSGKVKRIADPLAVKFQEERKRRINGFISQGIEYMDAINKVKQWEASL